MKKHTKKRAATCGRGMKTLLYLLTLQLLILLTTGCGNRVAVNGAVTFEDGKPLAFGKVVFFGTSENAVRANGAGFLNEKGEFRIGVRQDGDGLPPGRYRVAIQGTETTSETKPDSGRYLVKNIINSKYQSPETSEIQFEVPSNDYNIRVKP